MGILPDLSTAAACQTRRWFACPCLPMPSFGSELPRDPEAWKSSSLSLLFVPDPRLTSARREMLGSLVLRFLILGRPWVAPSTTSPPRQSLRGNWSLSIDAQQRRDTVFPTQDRPLAVVPACPCLSLFPSCRIPSQMACSFSARRGTREKFFSLHHAWAS
ncbi:hypothetical protein BS50DRAFT_295016 [Corynespora cassiicola Philippines]|uniref:Uncharacterized protein n=1 Tax=Corynespora cassiicola Philippines TaxID=1448308 RepID=A0A2T2NWD3_CORCC|nr:hypothetical protein BS50DRAFT_295016 [Corynespora cassiicola Philippines]